MRIGLDLLGLAHPLFGLRRLLKDVDRDTPIGFFFDTFGDSRDELQWMMSVGFHTFRVQMYWADNHSIVPMDVLRRSLIALRKVTESKQVRLYVSPSCEHAERDARAVQERLNLVDTILPYAVTVNNPWEGRGASVMHYLHEYHGGSPGRCDLVSTDGTNVYDIDAKSYVEKHGNREHPCFLWGYRFNLREITDPGQKPPPIPKRTAAPSPEYFKSILRLCEPMGQPPKPSFECRPFGQGEIYKTHAEDDQEENESTPDERRENRPVLIVRPNVPVVDILCCRGERIGTLPRFGDFPGGLTRYYAGSPGGIGLYGYQIGDKAKTISGSEFVWFRAGKKIIGPVNPAFRAGVFR